MLGEGEREGRREWERKRKKRKIGKRKGGRKEEREREIVRAPAKSAAATAGWSAMRALSGDTQRVARSGKKKMGRQPNLGVRTAKIAGKGFKKKLGASDGRDVPSSTTKINF